MRPRHNPRLRPDKVPRPARVKQHFHQGALLFHLLRDRSVRCRIYSTAKMATGLSALSTVSYQRAMAQPHRRISFRKNKQTAHFRPKRCRDFTEGFPNLSSLRVSLPRVVANAACATAIRRGGRAVTAVLCLHDEPQWPRVHTLDTRARQMLITPWNAQHFRHEAYDETPILSVTLMTQLWINSPISTP